MSPPFPSGGGQQLALSNGSAEQMLLVARIMSGQSEGGRDGCKVTTNQTGGAAG
jgi:hypothetical protein